jgi:hypothetical protein
MSNILEKLASGTPGAKSSDHLQIVAKRAAGKFVRKEASSVEEAIVDSISSEGLNNDQIERVTEMANQAAWKTMFVEHGNAETSFNPASSDDILASLDKSPSVYEDPTIDYYSDPPAGELKSDAIDEAFKVSDDYEDYEALSPLKGSEDTHEKAASVNRLSIYSVDTLRMAMDEVGENFYGFVKQAHIRDDLGILQITRAIAEVVESEKFASAVMQSCADRLKNEGVKISAKKELEKSAQAVVVNTEHPLLTAVAKLEKLAQAHNRAESLRLRSSVELAEAKESLRKGMNL